MDFRVCALSDTLLPTSLLKPQCGLLCEGADSEYPAGLRFERVAVMRLWLRYQRGTAKLLWSPKGFVLHYLETIQFRLEAEVAAEQLWSLRALPLLYVTGNSKIRVRIGRNGREEWALALQRSRRCRRRWRCRNRRQSTRSTEQHACFSYRHWKRCVWGVSPGRGPLRTGSPDTIRRRHEAREAVEVSLELAVKRIERRLFWKRQSW